MVPIHDNFLPILKGWLNEDLANGKTANDHITTYRNKPILRISNTFSATKKKRESQENSRPMPFAMPLQQMFSAPAAT